MPNGCGGNASTGKSDDSAPYYEEILVKIDENGAPTSAVPPLVNMLSTLETRELPAAVVAGGTTGVGASLPRIG